MIFTENFRYSNWMRRATALLHSAFNVLKCLIFGSTYDQQLNFVSSVRLLRTSTVRKPTIVGQFIRSTYVGILVVYVNRYFRED